MIKMKKYLVLIVFALVTVVTFAQNTYQDVVYLKNGSIIRGLIIEQIPNKSIKIETADRNVFVYQIDEIEKLTKELNQVKNKSTLNNTGLKPGHKGIVELGYQIGVGDYGFDRFKLNYINARQFNPYFSIGIGTGLRYYFDADAALIPLFADFRVNFINNKVSPYFASGIGYSFNATNDFEGVGLLSSFALGVSFKVSDKSSMNIGLDYEMQNMEFFSSSYYGYEESWVESSGAISINVGISF